MGGKREKAAVARGAKPSAAEAAKESAQAAFSHGLLEILDRRREIVEHPFGSIKRWMNQGAFLMRGLENVRAEFSLTALVYNLRRALSILGVGPMMAALRR
jgi:hypothetical protein